MKLFYFALCVLFFFPGRTLAADDDEAGPSNRPSSPPLSKMTRKEITLEKIAQMQAKIKSRKARLAELLAISSNPKSGRGAKENADIEWSNLYSEQRLEQQILDITINQY